MGQQMKKNGLLLVAAAITVSALMSACVMAPVDPYYDQPVRLPPPPRHEYLGYAPAPDYVWISGYWGWGARVMSGSRVAGKRLVRGISGCRIAGSAVVTTGVSLAAAGSRTIARERCRHRLSYRKMHPGRNAIIRSTGSRVAMREIFVISAPSRR